MQSDSKRPHREGSSEANLLRASDWYATLSEDHPIGRREAVSGVFIRRFADTPCEVDQPALSDTVLCMHLGGGKEVLRRHNGRTETYDVALGALTMMPAGESNRWQTRGPIEYAHIAIDAPLIAGIAREEFDCEPSALRLRGEVGFRDTLLEMLFVMSLEATDREPTHSRLYWDSLMVVLLTNLLKRQSERPRHVVAFTHKGGLAGGKLTRIEEYLIAHMGENISLGELCEIVNLSRAQFFRAFRQSTSTTPYRYLTKLRLEHARNLLRERGMDETSAANLVGLGSAARLRRLLAKFGSHLPPR